MKRIKLAGHDGYVCPAGTAFVKLRDLTPEHRERTIEVRDANTGRGTVGHLVDANHYLFEHTVVIRFEGEVEGIFANPDDIVAVHRKGRTVDDVREWLGRL